MTKQHAQLILQEIGTVISKLNDSELSNLVHAIKNAKKIVLIGAGRVGLAVRGFAMRLGHLGLSAHMLGDATVPAIFKGDLLVVASGSGETETIYRLVCMAKRSGARVALLTGNPRSRMGRQADVTVKVLAPSKTKKISGFVSIQPMTTLNEQSLGIIFDAIVLCLMHNLGETHETMWKRHSNLE